MAVAGGRIVQALGAFAGPVLARAMGRDLYAREHSARMLSTLILIKAVAPLLGPLLGGQLRKLWSLRSIFFSLAGVDVLTVGIAGDFTRLPPNQGASELLWLDGWLMERHGPCDG